MERKLVSSDHFKQELRAQLDQANKRGAKHILINSHELQVAVGGFPRADSVPSCCDVMENEMKSRGYFASCNDQ